MPIQSKGRMIRKSISKSEGFAALSKEAQVLFCMLIPHQNSFGKMNGSPHYVKGEICPKIGYLTITKIEQCLQEISNKTQVKWFQSGGLWYLHSLDFEDHNNLRDDRRGDDELPDYSRTTPGGLLLQVEVKDQVEVQDQGASARCKNFDFEFIFKKYPNRVGKAKASEKFKKTVLNDQDFSDIQTALKNYIVHLKNNTWKHAQNASTWFGNWRDWLNYSDVKTVNPIINTPPTDTRPKCTCGTPIPSSGGLWICPGCGEQYGGDLPKVVLKSMPRAPDVQRAKVEALK